MNTPISRKSFVSYAVLGSLSPFIGCFKRSYYYADKIDLYYRPEMALKKDEARNYSKSPLKPRLFVKYITRNKLLQHFRIRSDWRPFNRSDFLVAHQKRYVDDFFNGKEPLRSSNGLVWTRQFADSVRYTNASLYHALRAAVRSPWNIALSPSSGFHHAGPESGSLYCTFSGQVIASVKVYREMGLSGAYFDLDGHFGNSIEDSRYFVPDLNKAVPRGCNVNPTGYHREFVEDLARHLKKIERLLKKEKIHYVVLAHGADSHEWDNLGGQCTTAEWLECSRMIYKTLDRVSQHLGRPVPLVSTFFGGYRSDHFDSVLSLHAADAVQALRIMANATLEYQPNVKRPKK